MRSRRALVVVGMAAVHILAVGSPSAAAPAIGPLKFRDVSGQTGIAFKHTDGSSGRRYIVETVCAGLATFDYDGDGRLDIYFLNGAPLPGAPAPSVPPRNALYRNTGNWRFVDVTGQAGVGDTGYGLGVAVADYDNDGRPDLYVNNFGSNVLYRNQGDGTFRDATQRAGLSDPNKVGAGTCFVDIDQDGRLDLFVGHYLDFTYEKHKPNSVRGIPVYAGPNQYQAVPNALFRNQGEGRFADISRESGIAAHAGRGMGVVAADYDNDGDSDIFVANDVAQNFLFCNDGKGRFEEVGVTAGIAFDLAGNAHGSMGVDSGDYDNDGVLDFYVTSYQRQMTMLFRGLGSGMFEDVTRLSGAGEGTFANVSWGCGFADFNNDGQRDIFVACGHIDDNVELFDDTTSYRARNILLINTGDGRFVDATDQAGDGMQVKHSSRGAAFDDLDNDGDIDVVILNSRQQPTILRNLLQENGAKSHWVQIQLRGVKSNRDGVGGRVKVMAENLIQVDEVHSGRGYQSHFGSRLHFGLGKRERIDRIEVRWPGGGVEVVEHPPVDRLLTIREGEARPAQPRPAAPQKGVRP